MLGVTRTGISISFWNKEILLLDPSAGSAGNGMKIYVNVTETEFKGGPSIYSSKTTVQHYVTFLLVIKSAFAVRVLNVRMPSNEGQESHELNKDLTMPSLSISSTP